LYLACTNPQTVKSAAAYGVAPMILGFGGPESIASTRQIYDEACATRDIDDVVSPGNINNEFVALCPTFLMDDREKAQQVGARALRFFAEAISHWSAPNGVAPAHGTDKVDNVAFCRERLAQAREAIARGEAPPTAASPLYNIDHAIGDRDTAIEYVKKLEAAGVTDVMCLIQMGTLTQDQQLETIRIFGEEVIPVFRSSEAAVA
jgi:hypothetical protein